MSSNAPFAPVPIHEITGIVLAGGQGQRMDGHDKGWTAISGKAMIEYVLAALRPQVGTIIISANRNHDRYAALGDRVVADTFDGFLGPLAGLVSGMQVATTPYVLIVPCDAPFIAPDLVARLYRKLHEEQAEISVAHDGERVQPVFALLKLNLASSLIDYLKAGERKINLWFKRHRLAMEYFVDQPEAFLNINNPEERADLEARLARGGLTAKTERAHQMIKGVKNYD